MAKSPKAISATFSGALIYVCHLQVATLMVPKSIQQCPNLSVPPSRTAPA